MSIITASRVFLKRALGDSEVATVERILNDQEGDVSGSTEDRHWELTKNQLIITVDVQPTENVVFECHEELQELGLQAADVPEVIIVEGLAECSDVCRLIADRLAADLGGITRGAEQCS
ncbi:hypothetical protein [Gimesia sp.]|uniref:hypothetical protein n=1 Tax=Gimesia sp. TaxID=2024833 RepID=UPI000C549BA9|nr:hypothetical protein [Gimesia sp.]MAX38727.1 hypothetical protein [Gimesia sp.]HAH48530.1 hypothetical protein [Planctomycetaceae bacterium]HBL45141.1 hypothetical protein [Planctomycetaceae bacterium]|tara:strand:+ start:6782 stop:7138 length:357 start_codon:yes stop_codon:yes gene_type:complete